MTTPREFRNALYQHLVGHVFSEDTASIIASEAETYAVAYESFQLRGIEFAAEEMGFNMQERGEDK